RKQELATAQNELCTAKDQIPPDMDGDTLSVALIKLKDERRSLQQQLATVTQERDQWKRTHELTPSIEQELKQQLQAARAEALEEAVKVAEAEPEMPGSMPDDMYQTIKSLDRLGIEEVMRIPVRLTKKNIAQAIRQLKEVP
ncbi:MAG TPA: hypothetical protein VIY48_16860, partial [Candidatus Paceibacterota bacterium]